MEMNVSDNVGTNEMQEEMEKLRKVLQKRRAKSTDPKDIPTGSVKANCSF